MNIADRARIFNDLVERERGIAESKGKAYAGKEDANDNFKRNAERLGLTKYQIWAVYFAKHVDSVLNAIKDNPEAPIDGSEGLISRIHDLRIYAGLLACLLKEDSE